MRSLAPFIEHLITTSPYHTLGEVLDFGRALIEDAQWQESRNYPDVPQEENLGRLLGRYVVRHGYGEWWGAYAAGLPGHFTFYRTGPSPGPALLYVKGLKQCRQQLFQDLRAAWHDTHRVHGHTVAEIDSQVLWRAGFTTVFEAAGLFDPAVCLAHPLPQREDMEHFLSRAEL